MGSQVQATLFASEVEIEVRGSFVRGRPSKPSDMDPPEGDMVEDVEVADIGISILVERSRSERGIGYIPAKWETQSIFGDEAKAVERIARAMWPLLQQTEDRCDVRFEDLGADEPLWVEARAAYRAAMDHICATVLAMRGVEDDASEALLSEGAE